MRRTYRKAKPKLEKNFRINYQINAPFVFLISETNEQIGKTPISKALARAKEFGMDLVEVNPKPEFPVVKIMNYGQFKYEKEKKAHKQKVQQKRVETKGIRLSMRISSHDFNFRINQAIKFLEKGNKLKIELILKGRERQHPRKAVEVINNFIIEIEKNKELNLIREQDLTKQGGKFTIVLVNKKN